MFHGHVFNKDGTPISGIRVSDGRNITITDDSGYYELSGYERTNIISVQMLTKSHNDWFIYINGSDRNYDFKIDPYHFGEESSFLHFSDTEIGVDGADSADWLDFVKEETNENKPDFIIHTGDICRKYGLEKHYLDMNSENMGVPVRYTLGNHDYVDDKYGEYTFERLYGPLWYSFDAGNVHYVCLPIPKGEVKGLYTSDDRLIWLKNDLKHMKKEQKLVIFSHGCDGEFTPSGILESKEHEVDLKAHRILAWIYGHLHHNFLKKEEDRFIICTGRPDCGGIDSTPASIRFVKIEKDLSLTSRIIYNRKRSDEKCDVCRVSLPEGICFTDPIFANGKLFVATFNDGYPRDPAVYAVDRSGNVLWKRSVDNSVKWDMAYSDGRLYLKDLSGNVYCLDEENGNIIFKNSLTIDEIYSCHGGVYYRDGRLFTSSSKRLFFLDAESGETLIECSEYEKSSIGSASAPYILGDMIISGKHWDALYAFNKNDGSLIWRCEEVKDSVARSIHVDGVLYCPTRYGIAKVNCNGNLIAKVDGYKECEFNTASIPAYKNGVLYLSTASGGIRVFDCNTLNEIGCLDCKESMIAPAPYTKKGEKTVTGSPLIDNDTIIFGAPDGYVYFYDLKSYSLHKSVKIGHPIISSVIKTDFGYAVCDIDGGVSFISR